jgi:desampylase
MRYRLILPASLRARLLAEARAALPQECCGLLEGVRDGDALTVIALHPAANLSPEPETGFEIDPAAHFALQRALRGTERAVVGCYHSHPNGRAEPSPRDRAGGCEDGWVWLIIATGVIDRLAAYKAPDFTPLAF